MPYVARLLLVLFCAAPWGCSRPTYHVSGSITFAGKPIAVGRIEFNPDTSKSNNGPQGYAAIVGGKFDTRQDGQGHAGGPMVVRIEGFDVNKENPKLYGTPLFPAYDIKVELPKEASEKTFDVPASAKGP